MWLLISPSSPCAPEAAASNEPSDSALKTLASSFTWRGKPSAARCWRRRMKQWAWARRFCGRISAHSLDNAGVERWIASLRDTPASRSPWRASDVLNAMSGTFGPKFVASLRKSARDSVSLRTSQGTFDSVLSQSAQTFKDLATWLSRDCSRRRKSARRIGDGGCSSWPTCDANTATYSNDYMGPNLREKAVLWQTPRMNERSQQNSQDEGMALSRRAALWQTPKVPSGGAQAERTTPGGGLRKLEDTAENWPTPAAQNRRSGKASDATFEANARPLQETACRFSRPGPTTGMPGPQSSPNAPTSPRRLNPAFVEWLMGHPPALTAFDCSATQWLIFRERMRSQLCWLVLREGA